MDVDGAGNDGVRVDVAGVAAAGHQDVDPQIVQLGLPRQVEVQGLGVGGGVLVQQPFQFGELGEAVRQVVDRAIGGVARIVVGLAPFDPGLVLLGHDQAEVEDFLVQFGPGGGFGQRGFVNLGREEGAQGHEVAIALLPLWEKVAAEGRRMRGFATVGETPHPTSRRSATFSHKGRREGLERQSRLAAQDGFGFGAVFGLGAIVQDQGRQQA
ncbi:hypothetical protein D3C80_1037730 [compost metagenome]